MNQPALNLNYDPALALLAVCDVCEQFAGMLHSDGQRLCPRCARGIHVQEMMSDHLVHVIGVHLTPHLHAAVRGWAAYWIATGLLSPEDARGCAEWGLEKALRDAGELARTALKPPGLEE